MKKQTKVMNRLIFISSCFVIGFFGIIFVILPSIQSYRVVNDQVAEASFTKESMVLAIDGIPSTMASRDEAVATLASIKTAFPQQLANEELDRLLTQLCLDYSLAPEALSIVNNSKGEVLAFVPETPAEQASGEVGAKDLPNPATTETVPPEETTTSTTTADFTNTLSAETKELTETTTATDSADTIENNGNTATLIGVVNMEVTGTQANFYRLLDAVAVRQDIIITAFSITSAAATTGSASIAGTTGPVSSDWLSKLDGGKVAISVTFEVYMMES